MTSLSLSVWIISGILLQVAVYLSIVFWRLWTNYQSFPNLSKKSGVAENAVSESGFRPFTVQCKVMENAEQSICSYFLVPDDGQALPPFLPGQFMIFRLDLPAANGKSEQVIRCYSVSDAPNPNNYRISVKRVPAGPGNNFTAGRASNYMHDHIHVGSRLLASGPCGNFYIDSGDSPIVLIAGGIGITPILSMLNWSLHNQPGREIWLFYGIHNIREMMMQSRLEELAAAYANFQLRLCLSAEPAEHVPGRDYQQQGRIDIALLRSILPTNTYEFYICGPSAMLESLVPALENWGVPNAHIHFETFGPASINRSAIQSSVRLKQDKNVDTTIIVTFAQSGQQLPWLSSAASLLEFAEANGISVISSCRVGSCGSCQTKILAGKVTYPQPPDYDPEPNTCLLCVSTPQTSLILEA